MVQGARTRRMGFNSTCLDSITALPTPFKRWTTKGHEDERNLWGVFCALVKECRPLQIFGEQVASKLGREWLSGIFTDLETLGYISAAADLPAASVGAPHKRNRLFWCAVGNGIKQGLEGHGGNGDRRGQPGRIETNKIRPISKTSPTGRVADSEYKQCEGRIYGQRFDRATKTSREATESSGHRETFWSNSVLIPCADGKYRRVPGKRRDAKTGRPDGIIASGYEENHLEIEPLLFPLADGIPNRVGILRGAGNSIVPQVAAEFIKTVMEIV